MNVVRGQKTKVFKRFKKAATPGIESLSFSIMIDVKETWLKTTRRTLDVVVRNSQLRDVWVDGLMKLIELRNREEMSSLERVLLDSPDSFKKYKGYEKMYSDVASTELPSLEIPLTNIFISRKLESAKDDISECVEDSFHTKNSKFHPSVRRLISTIKKGISLSEHKLTSGNLAIAEQILWEVKADLTALRSMILRLRKPLKFSSS